MKDKIRIALLGSGNGSTIEAVIRAFWSGRLEGVVPTTIIASQPEIGVIDKAKHFGIPHHIINPKDFPSREDFGVSLLAVLKDTVDLVCQFGWLPLMPANVIAVFPGKIINQHPGPLDPGKPDFGGKGMYGKRAYCARIEFVRRVQRDFWTEVTTHYVTEEIDKGSIIGRAVIPLLPIETNPDAPLYYATMSLAERALKTEHELQIQVLEQFIQDTVKEWKREKPLVRPGEEEILESSKQIAKNLFPWR